MVKISDPQGSKEAGNYFRNEYSNCRESYYRADERQVETEEIKGKYFGQLATEMGLSDEVTAKDFLSLIKGRNPKTGEQLIRNASSKTYTNRFGEKKPKLRHRAGWDIVFSCPKSISLVAGPGGDKRIPALQREAVIETLREIEKYIAGKDGGRGRHTGKMVAAIFQHDCARPDRETGYAAPDLHDHVFVMNLTRDAIGKFRALEIDSLFRVRDFATQLHWAKLVEKMEAIGYEFERNPKTGAPEIKGFSAEYLAANSKRRNEVLKNETRLKSEATQAGFTVKGKKLRGKAARMNRRSKKFDQAKMRLWHLAVDAQFGFQAHHAVERAHLRGPVIRQFDEVRRRTQDAVTFARDHMFRCEDVLRRTEIEKHALQRGADMATYDAIKAEIKKRIEAGELFEIERGRGPELASKQMIDLDHDEIRSAFTSKTDKVARQKAKEQRERVRSLSNREVRDAISQMLYRGYGTEIGDRLVRLKAMVNDYRSNPNALVVCLRDDDRSELNNLIQLELQRDGRNKRKNIETTVLVGREVTGTKRRIAGAYQVGDIIQYYSGSKLHGIERGAYRRVIKVDQEQNTITIQTEKRKNKLTYDPKKLSGVRIYREETRQFYEGDKVQFRASFQGQRIATNEIGTITGIKGRKLTIKANKGRQVIVDVGVYRHLDLGYAVTSISAQGQTTYRVIFGADPTESSPLLNRCAGYVVNSSAVPGTRIYTNSIEELSAALNLKQDKDAALKAASEIDQVGTGRVLAPDATRETPRTEVSQGRARTKARETRSRVAPLFTEGGGAALDRKQDENTVLKAVSEPSQARMEKESAAKKQQPQVTQNARQLSLFPAKERQSRTPEIAIDAPRREFSQPHAHTEPHEARSGIALLLAEDREKVGTVLKSLAWIAGVGNVARGDPYTHSQERANDISALVRHCSPIAEDLAGIPDIPLDTKVKSTLAKAIRSLRRAAQAYDNGQSHKDYVEGAIGVARDALRRVTPDLLTWELARSALTQLNGNFQMIETMIRQGGRVERFHLHTAPGEPSLSVFSVRNLLETYTAQKEGIYKTDIGFDDRVKLLGHGDPTNSARVKEIEYDPIKIRTAQVQRERAQALQIERSQDQHIDRGGQGYSR